MKQAYNQIQRYHKTSFHGLFDYIQIFVISNGVNTRYFANNPNSGYKFTFNWTDAENRPFNDLNMFANFFSTNARWERSSANMWFCTKERDA